MSHAYHLTSHTCRLMSHTCHLRHKYETFRHVKCHHTSQTYLLILDTCHLTSNTCHLTSHERNLTPYICHLTSHKHVARLPTHVTWRHMNMTLPHTHVSVHPVADLCYLKDSLISGSCKVGQNMATRDKTFQRKSKLCQQGTMNKIWNFWNLHCYSQVFSQSGCV